MNLIVIGVICIAIIGVACLYFGKDGAIISTIIALIAGAAGFGVKKAKDELVPSDVKTPFTSILEGETATTVSYMSAPVKVPHIPGTELIDFDKVDSEVKLSMDKAGLVESRITFYSYLHNRATAARVKSLDEVKQWNTRLMSAALDAAGQALGIARPESKAKLDTAVEEFIAVKCQRLNEIQKTVVSWANRLDGHRQALERLEVVGMDWGKLADSQKTAWMVAELAYNPIVQIGIQSEDIVV